jgi:2-dehydro-3-deoxyphosphogluconate aldolase/(4S)-4-hydroxy-2-oxoglutarate aldolase
MTNAFSSDRFEQLPIVGILRGLPLQQLARVVEAAAEGGLTNIEITMNSPGAATQIQTACKTIGSGSEVNVGAGTVTSLPLLEEALGAGASFIVTPTLCIPVIQRCATLKVPVFPGAFSPSEIVQAWECGASLVKVFPADLGGPSYCKSLKAPLPHIRLMPTGGVDLDTLSAYAQAGAEGFGIGSTLFRSDRLAAQDWDWIRDRCRAFTQEYKRIRKGI